MEIYLLVGIFLLMFLSSLVISNLNWISIINMVGTFATILVTFSFSRIIIENGSISSLSNFIYIDSLSIIQLFIISIISFIASLYSNKYIKSEFSEGLISYRRAKGYYLLHSLFVFSMIFVCISNNVMGMWIGLEATTLSTAFLIGFSKTKLSLEAAWKYIIICSIGIGLGLVGIVLFIYSSGGHANSNMLSWTYLYSHYNNFEKDIAKIAFTFIFVGVGTKAGLAPMHTWLSDGHSEAPSPISAMMSGVLLNIAIYVIIRFYIIIKMVSGTENLRYLFIVFGCISLIVASFSILKQSNYKRLLAFSSVENIGIITLGIGFGGPIGIFGSLLHSIIHAFGKSLLFLVAGNILSAFKTKRIDRVSSLIKAMPKNAVFLILGMLIIVGAPPFASFFSEYKILIAGINNGYHVSVAIYVLCLLLVFAGFINVFIKMVFEIPHTEVKKLKEDDENILPLFIALAFAIFVSVSFGSYIFPILNKAALIISG